MALPLEEIPVLAGFVLAFSLAAPPGPANALIAQVAAARTFGAGWLTGLGAIMGDVVMFTLMGVGVLRVFDAVPWTRVALGVVGALLMAWFAWGSWRTARRLQRRALDPAGAAPVEEDVTAWGGFARSFVAVTTSPFNWGWWVGVGAMLFAQLGWGIVVGFFAGLLAWTALWAGLARAGAMRWRRFGEVISFASALVLAAFAIVVGAFAWDAALDLRAP